MFSIYFYYSNENILILSDQFIFPTQCALLFNIHTRFPRQTNACVTSSPPRPRPRCQTAGGAAAAAASDAEFVPTNRFIK